MIDEAKEEDDDVTYVCAAAMLSKQEMLDQVRLGRLLCSILRHRARTMGIPINTDGYVPVDVLMRHPAMSGYTYEEVLYRAMTDENARYKVVRRESYT